MQFYETAGCGSQVGEAALGSLLGELLRVLGGAGAGSGPDAERLVRILNNVCVRVLEHSPRTALLWLVPPFFFIWPGKMHLYG